MAKRVAVLLCSAWMVWVTGCKDECVDRYDCENENGLPAEGKIWRCEDNECVQRDAPAPEPEEDAGTDAGVVDGGMDGGMTDAGMTDAGTTDAGMNVAKGGACMVSTDCMAGLRCEGAMGSRTCQALHIAMTAAGGGVDTQAVAVRHDDPNAAPFSLGEATAASRYPRWNVDGAAIAFVEGPENTGEARLVTRILQPTAGETTILTDGGTAQTLDFRHLEWEPASSLVWTRERLRTPPATGTDISGISLIPPTGGLVTSVTANGGFPTWSMDGTTLAYSTSADGLVTVTLGSGTPTPSVLAGGAQGGQPQYNRANNYLLYLKARADESEEVGPIYELFTLSATGGTANLIAGKGTETVTGGEINSFISNPIWSPDGTWIAYVRAYYSNPPAPAPSVLCGTAAATLCPTREGNAIFLRRINPENGTPAGDETLFTSGGTLPSFSPDGRFIAYVKGKRLYVQQIDPASGNAVGSATVHSQGTDILTGRGDDHRPRWQPR